MMWQNDTIGLPPFVSFLQDLQRFGAAIMTFYLCDEIGDALVVQRIGQRSTKPPIEVRILSRVLIHKAPYMVTVAQAG